MTAPAWLGLAGDAFRHAQHGQMQHAADTVSRIASELGADTIPQVMLAWIDTTLRAVGIHDYGTPAVIRFGELDTGATTANSNDVHPHVAWAGRCINARAADDEASFDALLNAAQGDERTWASHVLALLHVCAMTTKNRGAMPEHHHHGGNR